MKLLRDFVFLGRLRSLAAARRGGAHRPYTVTVPAPLAAGGDNVVALRRPVADAVATRATTGSRQPLPVLARAANQ